MHIVLASMYPTGLLMEHGCPQRVVVEQDRPEPRWIEMPSLPASAGNHSIEAGQDYHDLGEMYSEDRKSTRLNSSHVVISYAVFCLKKQTQFFT